MTIISVQKLENADKDADSLNKFVNGADSESVKTRLNTEYPTLASAVRQIMETGGFEPFATETALLASVPTVTKKAAKALDTKKVWLWDGVQWNDTGLSEYDLAMQYASISKLQRVRYLNWLDKSALEQSGIVDPTWLLPFQNYIDGASVIKHVELINADPSKTYRINIFNNNHASYKDQIAIYDGTTAILNTGVVNITKSATGLTKVNIKNGSLEANLWIDYRELTRTGLIFSSNASPLIIAKSSVFNIIDTKIIEAKQELYREIQDLENKLTIPKTTMQNLYDDLHNPLMSVNIKLIGDSITWGSGASNRSPNEPRNGTLSDVRNTTDPVSPSWANLLRQWLCAAYTGGDLVHEGNGSAYAQVTNKSTFTRDTDYFSFSNPTKGLVFTGAQVRSYVGVSGSNNYLDLVSPSHGAARPSQFEFVMNGDGFTITYAKQGVGDETTNFANVYVDDVFHQKIITTSTIASFNNTVFVPLPDDGKHKITIKCDSTIAATFRIQAIAANKKVRVVNDGINGSSTYSWLNTVKLSDSIKRKDDYVFVQLGTNDRITASYNTIDSLAVNMRKIVDDIYTLSGNKAQVVLMSANEVTQDQSSSSVYFMTMRTVNNITKQVADEKKVSFISNFEATQQLKIDGSAYLYDGLHPNDLGYKAMFENIRNCILGK